MKKSDSKYLVKELVRQRKEEHRKNNRKPSDKFKEIVFFLFLGWLFCKVITK